MATIDVLKATIRAKVLAKHERYENYKYNYKLVILIQEMSYTAKDTHSEGITTGKIKADDFLHKANFYYYDSLHSDKAISKRIYNLTAGDIINFSIKKNGHYYQCLSLEVENEKCCYNHDLSSLVEQYGQDVEN